MAFISFPCLFHCQQSETDENLGIPPKTFIKDVRVNIDHINSFMQYGSDEDKVEVIMTNPDERYVLDMSVQTFEDLLAEVDCVLDAEEFMPSAN